MSTLSEDVRKKIRTKAKEKASELQAEVKEIVSEAQPAEEAPKATKPRAKQEKGLARLLKALREDVSTLERRNVVLARWGLPEVSVPDLTALEEAHASGFKPPRKAVPGKPTFEVGSKVKPVSDEADFELRSMYGDEDDRLLCAGLEVVKVIKASDAKNARVTIVVKNSQNRQFVVPKHLIEKA